jgi:peptide/nickel transport system substrate-binding protein
MHFRKASLILGAALLVALIGPLVIGQEFGGDLQVAMISEPPHLDCVVSTSDAAVSITQHWAEMLFTFDAGYAPVPFLVDTFEVSADGTEYVFNLRQGVLFHDGSEMTSEDVVASLQRWVDHGSRGALIAPFVGSIAAVDKYTVALSLTAPFGPTLSLLAFGSGGPIIVPASIAEAAGATPINPQNYIGTGPFEFVERVPGSHILLKRFENYVADPRPASSYAGQRVAYFDTIRFTSVPEAQTIASGVRIGDYHFAPAMPPDLFSELNSDPDLRVLSKVGGFVWLSVNHVRGIMSNTHMYRAVMAVLDMDEIAEIVTAGQIEADGSVFPPGTFWYSEAGTQGFFNQKDPDKGYLLATEMAGYNGEPIRFLTSGDVSYLYDASLVMTEQLRAAGFEVDLQVYDWATLRQRREDHDLWDLLIGGHGNVPDPSLLGQLGPTKHFQWNNEVITYLIGQLNTESDPLKRKAIWEDMQLLLYSDGPIIRPCATFEYHIASPSIGGFDAAGYKEHINYYFWNLWFD